MALLTFSRYTTRLPAAPTLSRVEEKETIQNRNTTPNCLIGQARSFLMFFVVSSIASLNLQWRLISFIYVYILATIMYVPSFRNIIRPRMSEIATIYLRYTKLGQYHFNSVFALYNEI